MALDIDFNELAEIAQELIEDAGRPLEIKRGSGERVYDPVEGTWSGGEGGGTTFPIRAVVLAMSTSYAMRVGTQNVATRDRLLLLGAEVQPLESDTISFDGEDWNVIRVEETAPNGVPLCFLCQVRP